MKTKLIKFTLLICNCFIISIQGRLSVRERLGLCPHDSALIQLIIMRTAFPVYSTTLTFYCSLLILL